ncbi:transporter substrate-binding domain-containing protein [Amaricoccus solimangrovi]|uniref:Transporter substrate-binding domain-containing protein n=1 Tax=Amaricoccus solimangrovi TaxID=2589815 RepID=A0A501WVJ8_9RHOB|nr:transporter substrate-binding domain-containing protein [Amaricoccus solimangrovi]TPE50981.1 transporter substrate-binding domain-containing protein [Amaricoccus solimangrovi]
MSFLSNLLRVLIGLAAVPAAFAQAAETGWELRVCADPDDLPFSNRAGEGFDNRIAEILAGDLGARLSYVWLPDTRARTRQRYVQSGACDMVMGAMDGQPGFLSTHAYYRTGYVFVYPRDADFEVSSLDDEALRRLRIGVPGSPSKLAAPSVSLANRGIVQNQIHFLDSGDGPREAPLTRALSDGKIDIALLWGPVAGMFAKETGGMVVTPVSPEIDAPFIPMVASMVIGLRPGDEALRDEIDGALSRRWDETRAVLAAAGVPLIDLPAPTESIGGAY